MTGGRSEAKRCHQKKMRNPNGNPLQYSCLGNPMDRGAWWATVHGVTESDMQGAWVQSLVLEDPTCTGQLSPCATTSEPPL